MYEIALFRSSKGRNILHSFSKNRQILINNEISVNLRIEILDQISDDKSTDREGHDQREASRNQRSKGSVIVRDRSILKNLCPLVNRFRV
jgi:hypothetical protein